MKKVLLVSAFALIALASCKKDYTCECTTTDGTNSVTTTSVIKDSKKKDAEADCETTVSVGTSSVECVIK